MIKTLTKPKNAISVLIICSSTLLSGCISLPGFDTTVTTLASTTTPAASYQSTANVKSTAHWDTLAEKISEEIANKVTSKAIYVEPLARNVKTPFNIAFRNMLITKLHNKRVEIYNSKDANNHKPINLSVRKMLSAKLNPNELDMLDQQEKPGILKINTQVLEASNLIEILVTTTVYQGAKLIHTTSNGYNTPATNLDYYQNSGKNLNVVSK
jgi:hypothetical protein